MNSDIQTLAEIVFRLGLRSDALSRDCIIHLQRQQSEIERLTAALKCAEAEIEMRKGWAPKEAVDE